MGGITKIEPWRSGEPETMTPGSRGVLLRCVFFFVRIQQTLAFKPEPEMGKAKIGQQKKQWPNGFLSGPMHQELAALISYLVYIRIAAFIDMYYTDQFFGNEF